MDILVSVILPNFNHAPYLQERVKSIINQTYQNFELIILDDKSTDDSLCILEPYRNHPKVSHFVVNDHNSKSPFKQWKKGLDLAKGSIIWIAESDDYCDLNFLETQVNILENNDVMVAIAKTILIDTNGRIGNEVSHPIFENKNVTNLRMHDLLKIPILNVSSMCFKRKFIKETSFFSNFNIIGDRVFYQEHFLNMNFKKNENTQSYFRRLDSAVSNFNKKPLYYKKLFFDENVRFIKHEYRLNHIDKELYNSYLTKFYNKIRNRTSKSEKLSFKYVSIFLKYIFSLKHS